MNAGFLTRSFRILLAVADCSIDVEGEVDVQMRLDS